MAGVTLQHRVTHATDQCVCCQEVHHLFGVAHMARHAQWQGFDALQNKPCRVGTHARAKISQTFAPSPKQKGANGAFFVEHHVVKALVGLCEFGKFALGVGA